MRHLRPREPKHENPTGRETACKPVWNQGKSSPSTFSGATAAKAVDTLPSLCNAESPAQSQRPAKPRNSLLSVSSAGVSIKNQRRSRGKLHSQQLRDSTCEVHESNMDDLSTGDELQLSMLAQNTPKIDSSSQDVDNKLLKVLRVSIPCSERELSDQYLNHLKRATVNDPEVETESSVTQGGLCCCCLRLSCSCTEHLPSCVWSPIQTKDCSVSLGDETALKATCSKQREKSCQANSASSTHHCQEMQPVLINDCKTSISEDIISRPSENSGFIVAKELLINSSNLTVLSDKTDKSSVSLTCTCPKEVNPASGEGQNSCAPKEFNNCYIHSTPSQRENSESASQPPEGSVSALVSGTTEKVSKEESLLEDSASSKTSALTYAVSTAETAESGASVANTVKLNDINRNSNGTEENTLDSSIPNNVLGQSSLKQDWTFLKTMASKELLQNLKCNQNSIEIETQPKTENCLLESTASPDETKLSAVGDVSARNSPYIDMPSLNVSEISNSDTQDSWMSREMPNLGSPMVNIESEATSRISVRSVIPCPTPDLQVKEEPPENDLPLVKEEPPEVDLSVVKEEPWRCHKCDRVIAETFPWLNEECLSCDGTESAPRTAPREPSISPSHPSNHSESPSDDNAATCSTTPSVPLLQSAKKESPGSPEGQWPPPHLAQPVSGSTEDNSQFQVNPTARMPTVGMITEVQAGRPLRPSEAHNMCSVLDGADEIIGLTNEMVRFCVSVVHNKGQPPPGKTFVFPVQSPELVKRMEQKWHSGDKVKVTRLSNLNLNAKLKVETSPEKCGESPGSPLPPSAGDLNQENSEGCSQPGAACQGESPVITEEPTEIIKNLNSPETDFGTDSSAMDEEAPVQNTEATAITNCEGEIASILSSMVNYVALKDELPEIPYDPDDECRKQASETNMPSKSKAAGGLKSLELECRRLNVNLFYMPQKSNGCTSESCVLGCVCDSLQGHVVQEHCGKPDCVLECSCETRDNIISEENKPGNLSRGTMLWIEGEAKKNLAKEECHFQQTVVRSEDDLFHLGKRQRRVSRLPTRFSKDFFLSTSDPFARGQPKNSEKISPGKSQASTKKVPKTNHPEPNSAPIEVSPSLNSSQKVQTPAVSGSHSGQPPQSCKVTACLEAYNKQNISHDKMESDSLVIASVGTLDPADWESTDLAEVENNINDTLTSKEKKHIPLQSVCCEFNFTPPGTANEVLLPCRILKKMFKERKAFVWLRRKSLKKAEIYVTERAVMPKDNCVEIRDLTRMLYPKFPFSLDILLSNQTSLGEDEKLPLWVLLFESGLWSISGFIEHADCDVSEEQGVNHTPSQSVRSPAALNFVDLPRKESPPDPETELCIVLPRGQSSGGVRYESRQELPLRWLLLSLKTPSPFDGVYFYLHQKAVGFKQLCTIALLANETGKYHRLNLPPNDMSSMAKLHPDFAVFGLPGFKSYIVMGPYKGQQKLGFSLFKREPPYRRIGVPLYCGGPLGYGELDGFSNAVSEPSKYLPADGAKSHWLYVASQSERNEAEMEILEAGFDLEETAGRNSRKIMNYLKRAETSQDTGAALLGRMKHRSSDVSIGEKGKLAQPFTSGQRDKSKSRIRQLDRTARKTICVPELTGDTNRIIEDLEYELDLTESDTIDPTSSQDEDDVALSVRMQYIMPSRRKTSASKKRKCSDPKRSKAKAQKTAQQDVDLLSGMVTSQQKQVYLVSGVKNLGYLIIDELVNGFYKIQNAPLRFPIVHSNIKSLCRSFNKFVLENIRQLKTVTVAIRWALVPSKIECGTQTPFSSKVFERNYLLLPGIVLNLHSLDVKSVLELRLPRDAHKELLKKLDDDDCNYELRYEANRLGLILQCTDKTTSEIRTIAEIAKKEVNRLQEEQVHIQEQKLYLQFHMKELLTKLSVKLKGTPPHYLEWAKNEALRIISTKSKRAPAPVEIDESALSARVEDDIEEVEVSSDSDSEGQASYVDELEEESMQCGGSAVNEDEPQQKHNVVQANISPKNARELGAKVSQGLTVNEDKLHQNHDLGQANISHKNARELGAKVSQSLVVNEDKLHQNHDLGQANISHKNAREGGAIVSQGLAVNEDEQQLNHDSGQVEVSQPNTKKRRPKKKKENPGLLRDGLVQEHNSKEVVSCNDVWAQQSKESSGSAPRAGLSLSMSPFTRVNLVVQEDRIIQSSSNLSTPLNVLATSPFPTSDSRKRRKEAVCHIPPKVLKPESSQSMALVLPSGERSFSPSDFLHSVDDAAASSSTVTEPSCNDELSPSALQPASRPGSQVNRSDKKNGTKSSAQKDSSLQRNNAALSSNVIDEVLPTSIPFDSSEANTNLTPLTTGTPETVSRVTKGVSFDSNPEFEQAMGRGISVNQETNCPPILSTNVKTFSGNSVTVRHPVQTSGGRIVHCSPEPIVHSSANSLQISSSMGPGSQILQSPLVEAQHRQTLMPRVVLSPAASSASHLSPPSTPLPSTTVPVSPVLNPAFSTHQKPTGTHGQVAGCNTTLPPLPTLIPRPKVTVIQRAAPCLTTSPSATVSCPSTYLNMASTLSSVGPMPATSSIKFYPTPSAGGQTYPRMLGKAVVLRFAPASASAPRPGIHFVSRQVRHIPSILRGSTSVPRKMESESITVHSSNKIPSPITLGQCADGMLPPHGITSTTDNVTTTNEG